MAGQFAETSPRLRARTAGALYLITIAAGVFAEVFVRGAVLVRDAAAATSANILARETLYRLGLAADLVMLLCYVAVTLLFYDLFRPAGRGVSLLAAFFSMVGIAVLAVNSLNHLAPLLLLGGQQYLGAFDTDQLQALALLSLRMHARGYTVSGVFFGIYMLLLGYLIYRSGFLPRVLGALMALGGLSFLANSFAVILLPALVARLPDAAMLGGVAELALSLWLLARGVNVPVWEERASTRIKES
ncbi:MAG TPA: DUF4386 domain-containing protein [Pyrinomonadaceae bacterium]|nr:DUF4386 domain-containing protein [Pyrinomonadaceae bacterium]